MTITEVAVARPTTDAEWIDKAATVAAQIAPFAAGHDKEGTFVQEAFDILRSEGFASVLVPAEFGGAGVTHMTAGAILTELAMGCPSTAVTLSMHYHLVATQVWRHKHGQPAEAILRKVAAEDIFLISTGAADWVDSYGEAIKVDGGFKVSARKSPSSGAPAGDILVTSIPWADSPDGPQVIHCAIPFAANGISIDETWDSMGLRGTGSHTVVLDEVFVPDAAISLIRQAHQWHPVWNAVLGSAMPLIMSAYLGIAESAAAIAISKAESNPVEHVVGSVGDMVNQLTTVRDAVSAMLASSDNLNFAPTETHSATVLARKVVAAEAAIATVRCAMDVCGGAGFSTGFGLERLFRDVHGALHHPLPAPKQRVFTGRVALGLSPVALSQSVPGAHR